MNWMTNLVRTGQREMETESKHMKEYINVSAFDTEKHGTAEVKRKRKT